MPLYAPAWLKGGIVVNVLEVPVPRRVVRHHADPRVVCVHRVVVHVQHTLHIPVACW